MKRILTSLLALTIFSSMVACAKTPPDDPKKTVENAIASSQEIEQEILDDVVATIQNSDSALVDWDKDDEARVKELIALLRSHLSYTVGDSTVNEKDGTAIVTVNITNVDMGEVMKRFTREAANRALQNALSGSNTHPSKDEMEVEYFNLFKTILDADDLKTVTVTAKVPLELRDGEWVIQDDREIVKAILGDLYKYYQHWEDRFANDII